MVDRARRVMGKELQTLDVELQAFNDRTGTTGDQPGSGSSRVSARKKSAARARGGYRHPSRAGTRQ